MKYPNIHGFSLDITPKELTYLQGRRLPKPKVMYEWSLVEDESFMPVCVGMTDNAALSWHVAHAAASALRDIADNRQARESLRETLMQAPLFKDDVLGS